MPDRRPQTTSQPAVDASIAETLKDYAALWTTVQKHAGEFIAVVDRDGIIRALNRIAGNLRAEDIVGQSFVCFTTPESTERLTRALDEVFRSGTEQTTESTVQLPDGSVDYFFLRLGPIVRHGRTAAAMVFAESIRSLKTSEDALQRERTVLRKLIDIQERERQLVSYEIHDGLAQYLAGAIMHLEAHLHSLDGRQPRELIDGVRLVRAAAEESRRLISGLRPPALDELGIVEAIESLVADARIEIPHVEFAHDLPDTRLSPAVETAVFRIVQESLTNARRHAHAGRAAITVEQTPAGLHVRVVDDGRGFDPATIPESRFGLESIRQRCRLFGVAPTIDSSPGRGTVIDVVLPLGPPEA